MRDFHGIDLRIAAATREELKSVVANSYEPVIIELAKRELASRDAFAASVAKLRQRPALIVAPSPR